MKKHEKQGQRKVTKRSHEAGEVDEDSDHEKSDSHVKSNRKGKASAETEATHKAWTKDQHNAVFAACTEDVILFYLNSLQRLQS